MPIAYSPGATGRRELIRPDLLGGRSALKLESIHRHFEREAQTTALLRSPHTVQLYGFVRTRDGTLFYVMELLEGIDWNG